MTKDWGAAVLGLVLGMLTVTVLASPLHADGAVQADMETETALAEVAAEPSDHLGLLITPLLGGHATRPEAANALLADSATFNGQKVASGITWSSSLSVALERSLSEYFFFGLKLQYAAVSVSDTLGSGDASLGVDNELRWLIPYATVGVHVPVAGPLGLGITAGLGAPVLMHYQAGYTSKVGDQERQGSVTYGAHPLAAYAALVGTYEVSPRMQFRGEAGYSWLKASRLTATGDGSGMLSGVHGGDAMLDDQGRSVPVDASAPYVEAGVTFRL